MNNGRRWQGRTDSSIVNLISIDVRNYSVGVLLSTAAGIMVDGQAVIVGRVQQRVGTGVDELTLVVSGRLEVED